MKAALTRELNTGSHAVKAGKVAVRMGSFDGLTIRLDYDTMF